MADITKCIHNLEITCFARGGCAVIHKADFVSQEKRKKSYKVAVKVLNTWIDKTEASENGAQAVSFIRRREREINVWAKARHPNILPFLGVCRFPEIYGGMHLGGAVGLVSPFCAGGSIVDYVKNNPAADVLYLMAQGISALHYLHSCKPPIIHGDIKGDNILIDGNGNVLLSDFGLSRILNVRGYTTDTELRTLRWSSVELFRNDENGEDAFSHLRTKASDVWAFGMTILEVLSGNLPFAEVSTKRNCIVLVKLLDNARPKRPPCSIITDAIWLLLQACWKTDPEDRPSAASVGLIWDLIYSFKRTTDFSSDHVSILLNRRTHNVSANDTQQPHPDQSSELDITS